MSRIVQIREKYGNIFPPLLSLLVPIALEMINNTKLTVLVPMQARKDVPLRTPGMIWLRTMPPSMSLVTMPAGIGAATSVRG